MVKKYIEVNALERLPKETGFYFCKVLSFDKTSIIMSTLRFGNFNDDFEGDNNFYATCDMIVPNERITWLEEIN